jgi:hypothetical protein
MGADIHGFVEIRKNGKWYKLNKPHFSYYDGPKEMPFEWRSYSLFGFLANVRNYSKTAVICEPKGLPNDSEYLNEKKAKSLPFFSEESNSDELLNCDEYHPKSWLTLSELLAFDYSLQFWDRRVMKKESQNVWNGASLAEEGEGRRISYKDFLGEYFFLHIEEMKQLGLPEDVRFVFWFDN